MPQLTVIYTHPVLILILVELAVHYNSWTDNLWKVDHVMVVSVSVKWNVIVKLLTVLQSSSKKDYSKFQTHTRK